MGDALAGSVYKERTGKLVVMVSDAEQLDDARAAGARARLVKHSLAELERSSRVSTGPSADRGLGSGGSPGRRYAPVRRRRHDKLARRPKEQLRARHRRGRPAEAAEDVLAKYGDAVTIEESRVSPTTTIDFMDGGDAVKTNRGHCSRDSIYAVNPPGSAFCSRPDTASGAASG